MEPNKTKSILSIFLTVLMMLGFSGLALAAHTTSYSEVPEWAQGAATETYTWTVTNNGPDNIDKVYITIPTGFGLVDCSASLPVNWNTLTSPPTGVTCAYQSQNPANDIMSGCFKDFGIDVSTPGTTGTTYQWRLYSSDVNGAFSATIDINTKVDADAPSISAISVTDGTNTATTLDGSEYLLDADAIVSFTVEDPASGIASVKVFYDVNGAATVADTALAVTDLGSGNYEATIPGTAFGDTDVVHFIVVAEDNVGNVATTADKSFIIDGVVDLVDNGGPYSYNEGDDFTFDGSGSSDLNGIVSYEWLIAAIPSATGVNPTLTWAEFIALSPSFGNDGSFVLLLRVTDGVGNVDTHSNTLTINNTAPTVEVTSPNGGEEWAGTHDITWTATDPSPQDEAALTFDINGSDDDGATYDVVIATGVSGNSYSWDTKTVTDDDDWMIKVVAHDDDTTSEDVSDADFMVDNTAPVIDTTGSDSSINEGDNLLVVLTSSHDNDPPGSGIATVEFDLDNDGVYDTAPTAWGTPFATSFAWVSLVSKGMGDDGTNYAITIRLTDKVGNQKEGDLLFDIVNVAPTTTAGSDITGDEGSPVTASASCTDPGTEDTWTATFDWGDGTDTVIAVSCDGSDFSADHTYADGDVPPTVNTVTITVEDDDLGSSSDTLTATISNVAPTVTVVEPAISRTYVNSMYIEWDAYDPAGAYDQNYTVTVRLVRSGVGTLHTEVYSRTYAELNDPIVMDISSYGPDGAHYILIDVEDDDGEYSPQIMSVLFSIVPVTAAYPISVNAYTIDTMVDQGDGTMCQDRKMWISADAWNSIPYLGAIQYRFVSPTGVAWSYGWTDLNFDQSIYYEYDFGWLWKAWYIYEYWWLETWWGEWYYGFGWDVFNIEYRVLLDGWYWSGSDWVYGYYYEVMGNNPKVISMDLSGSTGLCTYTVAAVDAMITDLQTQIDVNEANITANAAAIAANAAAIALNAADIDALELIVNDLQLQITSNDADIADLNAAIADLQTQIDAHTAAIADLQTQIDAHTLAIAANTAAIAANAADIVTLQGLVATLQGDVSALDARLTAAEATIINLQAQITANDLDIAANAAAILANAGDITALQDALDDLLDDLDEILGFSITDNTADLWTSLSGDIEVETSLDATCTWTNEMDGSTGGPSALGTSHSFTVDAAEGINVFTVSCDVVSSNNGITYKKDKIVVFNVNTDNTYSLVLNFLTSGSSGWRMFYAPYTILDQAGIVDFGLADVLADANIDGFYDMLYHYNTASDSWLIYDSSMCVQSLTSFDQVDDEGLYWMHMTGNLDVTKVRISSIVPT